MKAASDKATPRPAPETIMECPDTYIDTCKCPTPMVMYVRQDIADERVRAARRSAMIQAAKDVCTYCGKRSLGYEDATGPNSAGNYTHEAENKARLVTQGAKGIVLCEASEIYVRLRFEARAAEGEGE